MKDAFGGIANIFLIAIFLLIVSGILGFIVSYAKAFQMKNAVISAIERYEGSCSCFANNNQTPCRTRILNAADKLGYAPPTMNCGVGYDSFTVDGKTLFCYDLKGNEEDINGNRKYSGRYDVYSIYTQVDINIPIINKIMGLSFFRINGDTRVIKTNTNRTGC